MYWIVYGLLYIFSLLPLRILHLFSDVAYFFLYFIFGYRKKVVSNNLKLAFPEKSEAERKKIAKKFYKNFTDNFIEVVKLISASPAYIRKHFSGDYSLLDQLYKKNQRSQILLAHNFNWEWACLASALNIKQKFLVVYMPVGNKLMDKILMKIRTRTGAVMLPATDMRNAIIPYRNEIYTLILVADQNPGNPAAAYWVNFMNRPAPFLKAPESGARRGNTPVVYSYITKEKRGYYRVHFFLAEENPAATKPGELTKRYVHFLEKFLTQNPEMWLWSHRRWKHEWKEGYGEVME